MSHPPMDNGDAFMRAQREAQQQAINQYQPWTLQRAQSVYNAYRQAAQQSHPYTPGEKPEPEDTTGLKMLEEFLAKRKGERDGK